MREIKFRAWDGKNIHYWDSVVHPYTNAITGTPYPKLFYLPMSYLVGDSNDMVWMQYTGLKDKNGKEIFEGDIVKADFGVEKMNGNGKVEWSDGGYWKFISTKPHKLPSLLHRAFNIEIIGNIHDNPELLEQ